MQDLVVIHKIIPKAKCAFSGKEAECVVCSMGDYKSIQISWQTLKGMLRLKETEEKK
ncbi:hypothetical protein [Blastopirellula marina]|uniref:hypothetical protein n=1 Tax=Blastopirellula marina TaxID=124 RepID=UPI001304C455|nr:hypothetical protein [Blastopirellula marina]